MIKNIWKLSIGLLLAFSSVAQAYDWGVQSAHVTMIEGSYMPNSVTFQIDRVGRRSGSPPWVMSKFFTS